MNSNSDKLFYMEGLVKKIIITKNQVLYQIINEGNGVKKASTSYLADAIRITIKNDVYSILEQFPIHDFNPYINVFIQNVINSGIYNSITRYDSANHQGDYFCDDYTYELFMTMMTNLQSFVDQIRIDVQADSFRKVILDAKRLVEKNLKGLNDLIDSLFEHYNRLLVIRIDLGYRAGNIIRSKSDIDEKYNQAKQDFARFMANLKNHSLFTHKVGHVWKQEYGPDKGFHFHVIVFFNGSQVWQDVMLAKMLGKYWVDSVTHGGYHNCNGEKEGYQQCGIGMIHHSEKEKINYLKQAAAYLVKTDHYARMLAHDHGKTFSRTPILPPKTDGRGRPRAA